jgi:hypothetical protein
MEMTDRSAYFGVRCKAGGLGYFHTSSSSFLGANGTLLGLEVDMLATLILCIFGTNLLVESIKKLRSSSLGRIEAWH